MKKILFVDCFNTVILRKKSPEDVLFEFATELKSLTNIITSENLYILFKSCQLKLFRINEQYNNDYEYTFKDIIDEMYAILNKFNFTNLSLQDFYEKCLEIYIQCETKNQYVYNKMIEYLRIKKSKGCKIYIVSDFYLGKEHLSMLLNNLNIKDNFDDIFVSCDYKLSKRSGQLYEKVLNVLKVNRKNVLMIGDNYVVDNLTALKHKISTKHVYTHYKPISKQLRSIKANFSIPTEFEDLFNKFGKDNVYSNHAFPLYLYIKRLVENLLRNNVKNVFFFAREGYFTKQLFDEYIKINNIKINSHYFYISRNSIMQVGLKNLENEDFRLFLKTKLQISILEFLTSLDFDKETINKIVSDCKINITKSSFNFLKSQEFKELKQNKLFVNTYENNRLANREAFKKYLESFNVDFVNEGLNIVDVGWNGSTQNLFCHYVQGGISKFKITGYYMACLKPVLGIKESPKIGLLYSKKLKCPILKYENKAYRYRTYNYEQILRANHDRTIGYKLVDGKVEVIFDNKENEKLVFNAIIEPMQKMILEKFIDICNLDNSKWYPIETICLKMYLEMMNKASKADYAWLNNSKNTQLDTFAAIGYRFKNKAPLLKNFFAKISDKIYYRHNIKLLKKRKKYYL